MNDVFQHTVTDHLFFITFTFLIFVGFNKLFEILNFNPLFNPVLLTVITIVIFLEIFNIDFDTYFKNTQFINFLLGPATVALAIPLFRAYEEIKKSAVAVIITLVIGCIIAIATAVFISYGLGASKEVVLSFAPRSATSPIAISISQEVGGIPSLTASLVIITGIIAAMTSTVTYNLLKIKDVRARGFATGLVGHGIGTAHSMRRHEKAGAFAGLAMALNGVATAILTPVLVPILMKLLKL